MSTALARRKAKHETVKVTQYGEAGRPAKQSKGKSGFALKRRWFDPDLTGIERSHLAHGAISSWQASQQWRVWDYSRWAMMYGTAHLGFSGSLMLRTIATRRRYINPLAATFNGVRAVIDTVTATETQKLPVPLFTPVNGDWKAHRQAEDRNRFFAGICHENKMDIKGPDCFRDSLVLGDGLLYPRIRFGRVSIERLFPGDVYYNDSESLSGQGMREVGIITLMDRQQALRAYPDPKAQKSIMAASTVRIYMDSVAFDASDLIQINELYRLPSYEGADDGMHFTGTDRGEIECEGYEWNNMPFAGTNFIGRIFGPFSDSVTQILENLQLEYNELAFSINQAIRLAGRIRLFINSDSNLVVEEISNELGQALRGSAPPQSMLWQCVQPEVYERLATIRAQFFEELGVNNLNAQGVDDGVDQSGISRQIKQTVYSQRFSRVQANFNRMYCDLARVCIQRLHDIEGSEEQMSYKVYTADTPVSDPIDFKDLGFKKDEPFIIRCDAVSDTPNTPAGQLAYATQLQQEGGYDSQTARAMARLPDVPRVETLYTAMRQYGTKILDAMIEDGKYTSPENTDDVMTLRTMALQQLAFAKDRSVPDDRQDLVRQFLSECNVLIAQAQPPAPAQGAPAPAPAPASQPTP